MTSYFQYTRSPWPSFLFTLPLLVLYQVTALAANAGRSQAIVNGADGLLQGLLAPVLGLLGVGGGVATWVVLTLVFGIATFRADAAHREQPLRKGYFVPLLLESSVYAMLFGSVVVFLVSLLLPGALRLQIGGGEMTFLQKLAVSLGAGLYEELVFRLLMTGGLLWLFHKFGWKPGPAIAGAVLLASLIFSAFHYIGPLGEAFQVGSFTFRFVAGIVLAGLFALRGFAVAAWTHALYDVFLLLMGKG